MQLINREDRVQVGKDERGKWRWRRVRNGRIVAESGQGYARRENLLKMASAVNAGVWHFEEIEVLNGGTGKKKTKRGK